MSNFDEYFQRMRAEGRLDSTGVFTLDPEKVAWKLSKYQLAEPGTFSLFLVKAAVVGGATRFDREGGYTRQDPVSFLLQNLIFTRESIQDLQRAALGGGSLTSKYLMTAFSTAAHIGNVEILCYTADDGFGLEAKDETISFLGEVPPRGRFQGTVFRFEPTQAKDQIGTLHTASRFAPVPLGYLDPSRRHTLHQSDLPQTTFAVGHHPDFPVDKALKESREIYCFTLPQELRQFTFVAWHTEPKSRFRGLHHGILHPAKAEFSQLHFSGVFYADNCKLDVSYSGFVESDEYRDIATCKHRFTRCFLESFHGSPRSWAADQVSLIDRALSANPSLIKGRSGPFYLLQAPETLPVEREIPRFVKGMSPSAITHQGPMYLESYQKKATLSRAENPEAGLYWSDQRFSFAEACGLQEKESRGDWEIHRLLVEDEPPEESLATLEEPVRTLARVALGRAELESFQFADCHPSWLEVLNHVKVLARREPDSLVTLAENHSASWHWRLPALLAVGRHQRVFQLLCRGQAPFLSRNTGLWYYVLTPLLEGKIGWISQIQLTAGASIYSHFDSQIRSKVDALQSNEPGDAVKQLANLRLFDPDFWTLACALTLQWYGRPEYQRLWGHLFLQGLLGPPGSAQTVRENLQNELRIPMLI